jgi:nucleoid-associated protein YgaU
MLRKDVKLGFAIGGIMLAVVIVYVLVVPSGDRKTVSVVTDDSQSPTKTDISPLPAPSEPKSSEPETADKSNAPPADPSKADVAQAPTTAPSAAPSGNTAASGGSDWNKLLAEGSSSPTMMSETPSLDSKHSSPASAAPIAGQTDTSSALPDKPTADQAAAVVNNSPAATPSADTASDKTTPDLAVDTAAGETGGPSTQPAGSQRTHIVQPGEMLTSIAAAAYGDSRKWKRIAAANPDVNPNRLAPGTKLVIPTLGSAKESSASSSVANLDPQTQYEVESNDSLYRISVKLYGKPDHVDKLYEANKDVIGSDPKRLKLHMVLKLTDPPTAPITTASR